MYLAYASTDVSNRNRISDRDLGGWQWMEEKDSVEASGNSLVEQNQRDRRMIEEDSSNGRWHLSHRLQSHGDARSEARVGS